MTSWEYNGSDTLSVTFASEIGVTYLFRADDPDSSPVTFMAVATTTTLTISDIGGLGVFDDGTFDAYLVVDGYDLDIHGDSMYRDFIATSVFKWGETAEQPFVATWSFDGVDTLTVEFATEVGKTYVLGILSGSTPAVGGADELVGDGTTQAITYTHHDFAYDDIDVPFLGDYFFARLSWYGEGDTDYGYLSTRLFTAGDANAGFAGSPGSPSEEPTPLPYWLVDHYEHEFVPVVVGEPEIEDSGELIETVRPENLHFILRLGSLGPEDADYEISRYALNEGSASAVSLDMVGAYRTDFRIRRSDIPTAILAGMHTAAPSGDDGENPNDSVRIAGKGWLHYLERRCWPYDADLSYVNWPDGFRFKVAAAEIGDIIKDLLETIRDVSPNYPDPPDDDFPSYSLAFTVDCDSTGHNRNFEIDAFESQSMYEIVQSLSQAEKTEGGFDFNMTPSKVFRLVAPEDGDPDDPIFTLEVDAITHVANMLDAAFTNTGPEATHVLGVGAGTSTRQGGVNKHFRANSARYRRLDTVRDFGDVKDLDTLEGLTSGALSFGANPVHEIPITVNPADIPDFWNITRPGKYITVDYDFGWHHIESVQRIVEMDCSVDLEGNERVALSLNQYYDVSPAAGLADW